MGGVLSNLNIQEQLRLMIAASFTRRMLELLMSAYSTISIQDTALFLGMNENDATTYVLQQGWNVDAVSKMLTVKKQAIEAVGGLYAWPKDQVIFDEEVTPPTSGQKAGDENKTVPKSSKKKRKAPVFVSSDAMHKQAKSKFKSQKSLKL